MTYVVFFARGTLLVVFIAAVVGKLHSRAAWSSFVAATGSLSRMRHGRAALASAAVIAEMSTAVCLALDQTVYAGLVLALVVLTLFLVIVVNGVIRGVRTACHCFGSDGSTLSWRHVWRNAALTSVAVIGTATATASRTPSLFAGWSYAIPVVLSLVVGALLVMWDDFTALIAGPQP